MPELPKFSSSNIHPIDSISSSSTLSRRQSVEMPAFGGTPRSLSPFDQYARSAKKVSEVAASQSLEVLRKERNTEQARQLSSERWQHSILPQTQVKQEPRVRTLKDLAREESEAAYSFDGGSEYEYRQNKLWQECMGARLPSSSITKNRIRLRLTHRANQT